ncbi:MAG: hypothetical protein Q3M24_18300 [Candidatus Electrothrix aestuarii]|uniref:Uncharacterized protein n=1 Tax=Candidatus Electrothrix aestuarii TaxID=3062594 RepID=A0AAU8LSW8_9BACT|nr:hypothetical protein [Candidatus Electrothrix aestuarii]WPD21273.1 MAG: hypothetical protein SD837_13830 [Candidatus Electrothrix sp. GW3-3]
MLNLFMRLIVASILSAVLIAGTANAGTKCSNATITKAGVYPYLPATISYIVFATCEGTWSGELKFFISNGDSADALYAAALTAIASGNGAELVVNTPANYGKIEMISPLSAP